MIGCEFSSTKKTTVERLRESASSSFKDTNAFIQSNTTKPSSSEGIPLSV